jgi:BlaI family penicillinase repressor
LEGFFLYYCTTNFGMGKYIKPTEKEFEILSVLWQEGSASVKKVHEILASKTGYTTTLKLMQIMFEKGIVKRDTTTKQHIYKANYTKDQAKEYKVKQMLLELFDNDKALLIAYLSEAPTTNS